MNSKPSLFIDAENLLLAYTNNGKAVFIFYLDGVIKREEIENFVLPDDMTFQVLFSDDMPKPKGIDRIWAAVSKPESVWFVSQRLLSSREFGQ